MPALAGPIVQDQHPGRLFYIIPYSCADPIRTPLPIRESLAESTFSSSTPMQPKKRATVLTRVLSRGWMSTIKFDSVFDSNESEYLRINLNEWKQKRDSTTIVQSPSIVLGVGLSKP
jgi:hypothetical protein